MRKENEQRWYGRIVSDKEWHDVIEPSNFYDLNDRKSWGYRYKVRVIGKDCGDRNVLPDSQLRWANVVLPTTAGSSIGGFFNTPAIASGTLVTGYYEDFSGQQELYIDGIIINSNNEVPKKQTLGEIGGFDLFNDTYKSGSPQTCALVPDFCQIVSNV